MTSPVTSANDNDHELSNQFYQSLVRANPNNGHGWGPSINTARGKEVSNYRGKRSFVELILDIKLTSKVMEVINVS